MKYENWKRLACAVLASVLLSAPALGETYNPFEVDDAQTVEPAATASSGMTYNPFENSDQTATNGLGGDSTLTADDLFAGNTSAEIPTSELVDSSQAVSTDTVNNASANNPFEVGATPLVTATPTPAPATVSGYNPFDNAQEQPMQAVPAGTVMFVSASSTKLRATAADNGRVMSTAYFGQQLSVSATQGQWAQVTSANGKTAYCLLNDLTNTDPNTMSKQMYAQLNVTPLYKAPNQKTGRYRNLKKGDIVTQTAITSDGLWARVTDGTNTGFIPSIYLDDTPSAEGTPVWCMAGNTAVMVNPESWITITSLSFGQQCYLVGYVYDNTVAKIRSGKGYVAYCDASALTTADPATMNTPVYVQATGQLLGTTTGTNSKLMRVNKNSQLMLLGVDQSQVWALVRRGNRKLYIPYIYVSTERAGNNNRTVAVNQDVPLYSSASTDSNVLGTLPMGTRINLLGGDVNYAQVATVTDGLSQPVTGYVPVSYLVGV